MNATATPIPALKQITLRFVPIPQGVADRARRTMKDDLGTVFIYKVNGLRAAVACAYRRRLRP